MTVDTGGTKTLVASFLEDGSISKRVKFPTPHDQTTFVAQLVESIRYIADDAPIDAIVVAFPGVVKDNIAIWCAHLPWENFDIRPALKRRLALSLYSSNTMQISEAWVKFDYWLQCPCLRST